MNQDQIGGLVRTLIASVGGYFVGKGLLTSDQVMAIGAAAGPVIAAVWSFVIKRSA